MEQWSGKWRFVSVLIVPRLSGKLYVPCYFSIRKASLTKIYLTFLSVSFLIQ